MKTCLIIHQEHSGNAATISSHYSAFSTYGKAFYATMTPDQLLGFSEDFMEKFDSIIIHYSIYLVTLENVHEHTFNLIKNFKGYKICFIQDEYRHIDNTVDRLLSLNVDALYTVCSKQAAELMYRRFLDAGKSIKYTLTGFAEAFDGKLLEEVVNLVDWKKRPVDISYRGRDLTREWRWLGRRAHEKAQISLCGPKFAQKGLVVDISNDEKDRIYGQDWVKFLKSSKCCLITISGASVCDFSGKIQQEWNDQFCKMQEWKKIDDLDVIFSAFDGMIDATAISPRVFDAAAAGTLMIGYRDHYNGILTPNKHYIPLERDHSDIDEVIQKLKDENYCMEILKNCFDDLIKSGKYSYEKFVRDFEEENGFGSSSIIDVYPILQLALARDLANNSVNKQEFIKFLNVNKLHLLRHETQTQIVSLISKVIFWVRK